MSTADGFDDVDIDGITDLSPERLGYPHHSSLSYMYKRNNRSAVLLGSTDSLNMNNANRSTQALISRHSSPTVNVIVNTSPEYKYQKPLPHPPTPEQQQQQQYRQRHTTKLDYSPSRKLRNRRRLSKIDQLEFTDFNGSDDELDDSTIIFNVPLSQSLAQLTTHQKLVEPRLQSVNSTSTRNSSLLSYDHTKNDQDTDVEIDFSSRKNSLNDEAAQLTVQLFKSKSALLIQETAARKNILDQFERPKSLDSNLPVSTLKQKLISNTRPTNLPPKNLSESHKHSRQFHHLKQKAIQAELKLQHDKIKLLEERQSQRIKDLRVWENDIIPSYKEMIQTSMARELWWRGVPSRLRKFIWLEQVGNTIEPDVLKDLKQKSLKVLEDNNPSSLLNQINKDISKAFPDLGVFQKALFKDLQFVLVLYSQFQTYSSEVANLAAVLLYNINDIEKTFVVLIGLLQRNVLKLLYSNNIAKFNLEAQSFLRTFETKDPQLFHHFNKIKITPEVYLPALFKPIFSQHLSLDIVSRIIDVYIFEGDSMLWRSALGLFKIISYKLYGNRLEVLDVIGSHALDKQNCKVANHNWFQYLDVGDEDDFILAVRQVLKKN